MKKVEELRKMNKHDLMKLRGELQMLIMGTGKGHIHPVIPVNNGRRNAKRAIAQINTILKENMIKKLEEKK